MIVISSSMVLSEVDGTPEGTPWIGYHQLVTTTNIDASTEELENPVTNLANPATHLFWRAAVNTADEYITIETNYLEDIDYLAVAKHNFSTISAVVSVEGKIDDGNSPAEPYTELVQEQMLPDDSPVIFRWEPQPLTHVRLRIQQGSDVAQASVLYLGKLLVLERSIKVDADHIPIKYGRRSTIVNGMSESGNFLGRTVLKEFRESESQFAHFRPDWYRTYFDPFVIASRTIPFFYAWHPVTYPLECGYAWLIEDPKPEHSPITGRVAVDLLMRGIA